MSNKFKLKQAPQQPFDVSQAVQTKCECGHELFDKVWRLGTISSMATRNITGKNIIVEYPVYVCRECGKEYKNK
jgi:hypothetical protein